MESSSSSLSIQQIMTVTEKFGSELHSKHVGKMISMREIL